MKACLYLSYKQKFLSKIQAVEAGWDLSQDTPVKSWKNTREATACPSYQTGNAVNPFEFEGRGDCNAPASRNGHRGSRVRPVEFHL